MNILLLRVNSSGEKIVDDLKMEMVSVTAFGSLKGRLGKEIFVPAGQTAAQVVESLRLDSIGGIPLTAVVNSKVVPWDYVLQPGDKLALLPTIGGGCIDID